MSLNHALFYFSIFVPQIYEYETHSVLEMKNTPSYTNKTNCSR